MSPLIPDPMTAALGRSDFLTYGDPRRSTGRMGKKWGWISRKKWENERFMKFM
jgi:hypothetical protein